MSKKQTDRIDAAFFKAVVDNMGDAVHIMDAQGRILYSNPQAARLYGFKQKEMEGLSLTVLNRFNDRQNKEIIGYLMTHLQQTHHWTGSLESIKKDGSSFISSVKISLVKQDDGDRLICVQREIADKSKLRDQLQKAQMGAMKNARMAALGEMAAGIAHEINNPLAVISGNLHLIQAHAEKPDFAVEFLPVYSDKIERSIQRIQNVIKGMKTFVYGDNKQSKALCSARAIIEDSLSLCIEKFRNHGVVLQIELPEKEIQLHCNSAQISQILVNLLNNSFDATEELTDKWVKVDTAVADSTLLIMVTDSGRQIPPAIAKKIFKPFHSSKTVGMGLGLSLSRNFAEEHDGSLILDPSSPNTRFVLSLPLSGE